MYKVIDAKICIIVRFAKEGKNNSGLGLMELNIDVFFNVSCLVCCVYLEK